MKEAYYFRHDANARADERILELRAEYGWAGYGQWWAIVEQLRDASQYRLNNVKISGLAIGMSILTPDLRKFLDSCIALGLLAVDEEGYFYSPSLCRRMEPWDTKRAALVDAGKRGAAKRWGSDSHPIDHPNSHPINEGMATPIAPPMAIREEKIREEVQASRQADFSSSKPKSGKVYRYDNAPVFEKSAFKAYLAEIGYAYVNWALYLVQMGSKIKDALADPESRLHVEVSNDKWKAYILNYLNNDNQNNNLLLPDKQADAAFYYQPEPKPEPQPLSQESLDFIQRLEDEKQAQFNAHIESWASRP